MAEWNFDVFSANGANDPYAGDSQLMIVFRNEAVPTKDSVEGIPQFKDVDYMTLGQAGAKDPIYDGPVKERHLERPVIKAKYDAWKKGAPTPREGLPLKEWPFLTKARIMELNSVGVYTVEELSNVPDSLTHRLGLFGSQTRQKARDYLSSAKDGGFVNRLRKENEDLKADMEILKSSVAALKAHNEAMIAGANAAQGGAAIPQVAIGPSAAEISAMIASGIAAAMANTQTVQAVPQPDKRKTAWTPERRAKMEAMMKAKKLSKETQNEETH